MHDRWIPGPSFFFPARSAPRASLRAKKEGLGTRLLPTVPNTTGTYIFHISESQCDPNTKCIPLQQFISEDQKEVVLKKIHESVFEKN